MNDKNTVVLDKRTDEQKAADKAAQVETQPPTAEEKAKEIITEALEDKLISISGTSNQKLAVVVRYLNRDKLQARGENWFKQNYDALFTDAVETLISAREKAITDYLAKKEQSDKDEAFRMLISRGVGVPEAYTKVYGNK